MIDNKNDCRLIWSKNIQNNKLVLNNIKKPQYIALRGYTNSALVVNRIIGNPTNPKLIKKYRIWLKIILMLSQKKNNCKISLKEIHKQLISEELSDILKSITGNTQLSKTELLNLIPIKINK